MLRTATQHLRSCEALTWQQHVGGACHHSQHQQVGATCHLSDDRRSVDTGVFELDMLEPTVSAEDVSIFQSVHFKASPKRKTSVLLLLIFILNFKNLGNEQSKKRYRYFEPQKACKSPSSKKVTQEFFANQAIQTKWSGICLVLLIMCGTFIHFLADL